MRKMIMTALAIVSLVGTAGPGMAGVGGIARIDAAPSMTQKIQDRDHRDRDWERDRRCHEWDREHGNCRDRDEGCSAWDMRRHECRDWARDRWRGIESCRYPGHERYLNRRNHWERCPPRRRGGY